MRKLQCGLLLTILVEGRDELIVRDVVALEAFGEGYIGVGMIIEDD